MSKPKHPKRKRYNPAVKALAFFKIKDSTFVCKCGRTTAEVPIRYENGAPKYKLKITFDSYGNYRCYIISPQISYATSIPPHIYRLYSKVDEEKKVFTELCLCLHLPSSNEYSDDSSIMETIISWAIKWTEFYELWLLTGNWYGGGKHISDDAKNKVI